MSEPTINELQNSLAITPRVFRKINGKSFTSRPKMQLRVSARGVTKHCSIVDLCANIITDKSLPPCSFWLTNDNERVGDAIFKKLGGDLTDAFEIVCRNEVIQGVANSENGLRYALQTAGRLLKIAHGKLPAFILRDHASMKIRAVMVDLARQAEKIDCLEALIDRLSEYRCNMLMLYFQNRLRFKGHRKLWNDVSYSPEQMAKLGKYARDRGIELVPQFATLGHCEDFLQVPGYGHLADGDQIYQFNPLHKGTQALLEEMFNSWPAIEGNQYFHVACDEAPYHGNEAQTRKYIARYGLEKFFSRHINFMHGALKRRGFRMMLWGDMLKGHPGILDMIPKDIVINEWNYDAIGDRDAKAIDLYQHKGFEVMVAPAASRSAQLHFPLHRQIEKNIPQFVELGVNKAVLGAVICQWECFTRFTRWSQPGFMLGCRLSWEGRGFRAKAKREAVYGELFGCDGKRGAEVFRAMSPVDMIDRFKREHGDPQVKEKTYHLDTHELSATDPLVYMKQGVSDWERRLSDRFEQGYELTTQVFGGNGLTDRMVRFSAGCSLFTAWKRAKINEAGVMIREAVGLHDKGNYKGSCKKLTNALVRLDDLKKLASRLGRQAPDIWEAERYSDDPAYERLFGGRFEMAIAGTKWLSKAIRRQIKRIECGKSFDLWQAIFERRIYCFRISLPHAKEINILQLNVFASDNGKHWHFERSIHAFQKPDSDYLYLWMAPSGTLAGYLRVEMCRTQALWCMDNLKVEIYRLWNPALDAKACNNEKILTQEFSLMGIADTVYRPITVSARRGEYKLARP